MSLLVTLIDSAAAAAAAVTVEGSNRELVKGLNQDPLPVGGLMTAEQQILLPESKRASR